MRKNLSIILTILENPPLDKISRREPRIDHRAWRDAQWIRENRMTQDRHPPRHTLIRSALSILHFLQRRSGSRDASVHMLAWLALAAAFSSVPPS